MLRNSYVNIAMKLIVGLAPSKSSCLSLQTEPVPLCSRKGFYLLLPSGGQ